MLMLRFAGLKNNETNAACSRCLRSILAARFTLPPEGSTRRPGPSPGRKIGVFVLPPMPFGLGGHLAPMECHLVESLLGVEVPCGFCLFLTLSGFGSIVISLGWHAIPPRSPCNCLRIPKHRGRSKFRAARSRAGA